MARKAALVTSWTHPSRGREGKALEAFADYLTFWGKLAADGRCEGPEPFFAYDGSRGFGIVRGPSDVLHQVMETEEYEMLISKAQHCVDDLRSELFVTGDEEIQRGMRIYAEAAKQLGYL